MAQGCGRSKKRSSKRTSSRLALSDSEYSDRLTCPWGQAHKHAALWRHHYRIHRLKCTHACSCGGQTKRNCPDRLSVGGFVLNPVRHRQLFDRLTQHRIDIGVYLGRKLGAGMLQ
jgi:hypothetical protein